MSEFGRRFAAIRERPSLDAYDTLCADMLKALSVVRKAVHYDGCDCAQCRDTAARTVRAPAVADAQMISREDCYELTVEAVNAMKRGYRP